MSIYSRTQEIVAHLTGRDGAALRPDMNLVEDLGVDSLSKCELAIALERVFDIRLSDDDAEQIQTFGDAVSMVQRRLA